MSTKKESDNFMNELKIDAVKAEMKGFFARYGKLLLLLVSSVGLFFLIRIGIQRRKINRLIGYNSMIFRGLASKNPIAELTKLYNDRDIPNTSKTLVGLNLIAQYEQNNQNIDSMAKIYEEIFRAEKDLYLRYYAGLNLLILKLNADESNAESVENLMGELDKEENPLRDLVMEQKVLLKIKTAKYEEANTLLNELLSRKDLNEYLRERLNNYKNYIGKI